MSRRRVLFVSHMAAISGAEQVLLDLAADWPGAAAFTFQPGLMADRLRGLHLEVASAGRAGDLSGIRRDASLLGALSTIGVLRDLVSDLKRRARRADVVYANSQKAFTLSAVACLLARRPLVWHLHDILDAAHFGRAQRGMQIFLANRIARRVIVPSEAAAEAFRQAGGRPDLVAVIANGRDITPATIDKPALRLQLDLPEGPLVGVFSRLAAWKGQDVFLDALARLPGVGGIVVGSAMFGETGFEDRLKAQAVTLGIADRVRFLGRREDVPLLMQAVDAVVHPSIDPEPFGLTLIEAMGVGTPVIASSAGASREILDDGRFGTLVPPGTPDALATAIAETLAAPDATVIDAAMARARNRYSVAHMQAEIAAVIAAAAGGSRG